MSTSCRRCCEKSPKGARRRKLTHRIIEWFELIRQRACGPDLTEAIKLLLSKQEKGTCSLEDAIESRHHAARASKPSIPTLRRDITYRVDFARSSVRAKIVPAVIGRRILEKAIELAFDMKKDLWIDLFPKRNSKKDRLKGRRLGFETQSFVSIAKHDFTSGGLHVKLLRWSFPLVSNGRLNLTTKGQ
jgi:hypothetical protein